jgi:type I restriction enzyme, S subunit
MSLKKKSKRNWEQLGMKYKLGDFANITMGQSPKSEFYNLNGEGLPFLQGNRTFGIKYPTFDTWTTNVTKIANKNDIIMSVRAPVGDLNYAPEKLCLGRGVCSLRAKNNEQDFLFYLMKYSMKKLLQKQNGTVFGSVNRNDIENLEVDIPEFPTQKKIAGILSAIDSKIQENNKINDNLLQQLDYYYKEIFDITDVESISPMDEVFDISIGKTPPRKEQWWFTNNPADVRWVSISDMGSCGVFISSTSEFLTAKAIDKFNVVLVPDNTVILSFKLTIGRLAITDGPMATNEAIAHFKTKDRSLNPYLYFYLKNYKFEALGSTSSIATAVNSKIIKKMPFAIPHDADIKKFNELALPMMDKIKQLESENRSLSSLRDLLLPKLMSGEIDVDSVDI